jgi:hypothetical protein
LQALFTKEEAMEGSRFCRNAPGTSGHRGNDHDDLLEACRSAVSRVLSELPARDREVVEGRRAEVVAATHRATRAALEELVGAMRRVA